MSDELSIPPIPPNAVPATEFEDVSGRTFLEFVEDGASAIVRAFLNFALGAAVLVGTRILTSDTSDLVAAWAVATIFSCALYMWSNFGRWYRAGWDSGENIDNGSKTLEAGSLALVTFSALFALLAFAIKGTTWREWLCFGAAALIVAVVGLWAHVRFDLQWPEFEDDEI